MAAPKVVVIGAGPVGALATLYAAKRGYQVELYELRADLRDVSTVPLNFTKSINLALSERGINAIRHSGYASLLDNVMQETLPMHGRMIHGTRGEDQYQESQNYDTFGRCIHAVDRAGLNKRLLDELDKLANVKVFFNHKLLCANFDRNKAWFEQKHDKPRTDHAQNPTSTDRGDEKSTQEIEVAFDLMIGADGAHSATRYHMMKFARMNYEQEYIDTLWCEFKIAPSEQQDFRLSPAHLHIWPAGDLMFIAIPSLDKSFTCTLFASDSHFQALSKGDDEVTSFFEQHFPGVAGPLIPVAELHKQYRDNPHLPLISIKCSPHHYSSSVVILGDAAHAMVPFYGQGMNAGLEDVRVLFETLDKHVKTPHGRREAFKQYTALRTPDAHAINDLALRNYQEMRSDVKSPLYRLRKAIEEGLSKHIPSLGFATQYSRVSFGNMRYSDIDKLAARQGRILSVAGLLTVVSPVVAYVGWAVWRWNQATHTGRGLAKLFAGLGSIGERLELWFTR